MTIKSKENLMNLMQILTPVIMGVLSLLVGLLVQTVRDLGDKVDKGLLKGAAYEAHLSDHERRITRIEYKMDNVVQNKPNK
jgi:hypothetical protein